MAMYNKDTELLFPSRVIPELRDAGSEAWRDLVDHVMQQPDDSVDHLAFVLLMVRLNNCLTCHMDSFRAIRGCTQCSRQTVRRFRGDADDLRRMFEDARAQVMAYLAQNDGSQTQGRAVEVR